MTISSQGRARVLTLSLSVAAALAAAAPAQAQLGNYLSSDLIVSSSNYYDAGFAAGVALPYSTTFSGSTVNANSGSAFCANASCSQNVWNNATVDANFGLTSAITLSAVNTSTGATDASVNFTTLAGSAGVSAVTSFASKSELALNFTPDGQSVTFMAYKTAGLGQFDISNSNSFAGSEPGNTDTAAATQRSVIQFNLSTNAVQQSATGAYSGNNGRAAILGANGAYYTAGNAGNGNGSTAVTNGNGVQLINPGQNDTTVNAIGAYNITQQGYAADKTSKDSNYRGLTIFNNTLYVTKGSGGNGINTVYQVGTTGSLPTAAGGATPVSILPGFSTALAKPGDTTVFHPFGLFFANASTLYVADEGSGKTTDFGTNPTTNAGGLQKWSLVGNTWQLDYTLKGTLIGSSYTVNGTGSLAGDSTSVTTDGLRNIAGRVNGNSVTLYAVTSTTGSALGDAGADPNALVAITDNLSCTTAACASGEDFTTLQTAALGQVLRGVALAPVPVPGSVWLLGSGLLGLVGMARRRKVA